jgi:hypothetical protein
VAGDHLVVLDAGGAERLLYAPAWVYPRPAVVTIANE